MGPYGGRGVGGTLTRRIVVGSGWEELDFVLMLLPLSHLISLGLTWCNLALLGFTWSCLIIGFRSLVSELLLQNCSFKAFVSELGFRNFSFRTLI